MTRPTTPEPAGRATSPGARRYLIASRTGPSLDAPSSAAIDMFVARRPAATTARRARGGRRVVHMEAADAHALHRSIPHLLVEEDRPLALHRMPSLPEMTSYEGRYAREIRVVDAERRAGIEGVSIYGIGCQVGYAATTDASGRAILHAHEAGLVRLIASPANSYWSRVVEPVSIEDAAPLVVELDRLPIDGAYSWGHRLMQFDRALPYYTGRGIRIAMIDSGVSNRLGDFQPHGGWNTLDGDDPHAWNVDEKGHGTHCSGIVCAGHARRGVRGGAPDALVYSIKVFPGGYVSDLVEAVEWCIHNGMDVLNISLGLAAPSEALELVLREAWARGIITIAAAGNDATRVAFPAAFPTSIAVSAIGGRGTFPAHSAHALQIGQFVDSSGTVFSTRFSNIGPEITVCAPGVAIPSTVPAGYACWDGTSMACPMITALAALVLEACPALRDRQVHRPEAMRALLTLSARSVELPRVIQGAGLPTVPAALGAAAALFGLRR